MKKSLAIFFLIITSMAFGQNSNNGNATVLGGRHEIRFSIGDPFCSRGSINGAFVNSNSNYGNTFAPTKFANKMAATPSFTLGYRYRVVNWLWIGGDINSCGFWGTKTIKSGLETYPIFNHAYNWGTFFAVRFSYFNREKISLYSEVAMNVIVGGKNMGLPRGGMTLIGFNAGGAHWFGSAELGVGYKGFLNAGFGYRF